MSEENILVFNLVDYWYSMSACAGEVTEENACKVDSLSTEFKYVMCAIVALEGLLHLEADFDSPILDSALEELHTRLGVITCSAICTQKEFYATHTRVVSKKEELSAGEGEEVK